MADPGLKFSVIDICSPIYNDTGLVNNCYKLWQDVYLPIHTAANEKLEADAFYKAKFLAAIHDENKIPVAFCLHNIMDMRLLDIQHIRYFQGANDVFLNKMRTEQHMLMTVEWVTVRHQDRVRFSKLQYYDVIIALNNRLIKASTFTGAMGFSRMDMKVDRMLYKFGHKGYGEVMRHDIACQIMLITPEEMKPHPFKIVEKTADELWATRNIQSVYIQGKGAAYERAS